MGFLLRLKCVLLVGVLGACGDRADGDVPAAAAITVTDDAGREVRLTRPAGRVVSLIPSATETLVAIGAAERVVGRTRYDELPELRDRPSVGGGLNPSLEALAALRPDLVIVWDGERSSALRPRLEEMGIAVFALAADDTTDLFRSIGQLGRLTGLKRGADSVAGAIRSELDAVRASVRGKAAPSLFYVVSTDPPMTAGPGTFIAQIVQLSGGRSVFPDVAADWPTVAMEEIVRRDPHVVILPEGEAPVRTLEALRRAPGWRDLRAVREGRVFRVPSNLLNRPGPNLGRAARTLRDALHPELAGR